MSAVIKRKLRETWRQAVAARFAAVRPDLSAAGLEHFDRAAAAGEGEAEAAFATLSHFDLLWHVDNAGFSPAPDTRDSDRLEVPSV